MFDEKNFEYCKIEINSEENAGFLGLKITKSERFWWVAETFSPKPVVIKKSRTWKSSEYEYRYSDKPVEKIIREQKEEAYRELYKELLISGWEPHGYDSRGQCVMMKRALRVDSAKSDNATKTRICNIDNLVPPLSRMLSPVLASGERVIICAENTFPMGQENAYSAIVLTQQHIYYAFQDSPPAGGIREAISLQEVSSIERRITQKGYHQLVIYRQNGNKFTSCEFVPEYLIDEFINALSKVGKSVKPV
jgi:hypothetical protein